MPDVAVTSVPKYRLIAPIYFDDQYIPETMIVDGREVSTIIEYEGVPNEAMEPINEPAQVKWKAYQEMMDQSMRDAGRLSRKLEDIVQQEIAQRPREARHTVELPQVRPDVPAMGNITVAGGKKVAPEKSTVKISSAEPEGPAPIKLNLKDA